MEASVTTVANESSWEIVPTSGVAWIIFFIVFAYLFYRHILFIMMLMDLAISWLRRFSWFPGEGKRFKAFVHWIIALGVFLGFLFLGHSIGWIGFIPRQ